MAAAQLWDLPPGVPMLRCRHISVDQHGRRVEISDAEYPAERTRLDFVTPLTAWPRPASGHGPEHDDAG